MTLKELQLRVMAAFPAARISIDEAQLEVSAALDQPLDLECGAVPIVGLVASVLCGDLEIHSEFPDPDAEPDIENVAVKGDWDLAEPEIERRIRSVSAHQLIAARRRQALDELARLDVDLIMDEPAQVAPDAH